MMIVWWFHFSCIRLFECVILLLLILQGGYWICDLEVTNGGENGNSCSKKIQTSNGSSFFRRDGLFLLGNGRFVISRIALSRRLVDFSRRLPFGRSLHRGLLKTLLLVHINNHLVNSAQLDCCIRSLRFTRINRWLVITWSRCFLLLPPNCHSFVFRHFDAGSGLCLVDVGVFAWTRHIHQSVLQVLVEVSVRSWRHWIGNVFDLLGPGVLGIVVGGCDCIWLLPGFLLQLLLFGNKAALVTGLELQAFLTKRRVGTVVDGVWQSPRF